MRATSPAMRFSRKRAAFLIVAFSAASRLGVAEQLLDLRATAQATRDLLLAQDVLAAHVGAAALLDECRRADEQTEGRSAESGTLAGWPASFAAISSRSSVARR